MLRKVLKTCLVVLTCTIAFACSSNNNKENFNSIKDLEHATIGILTGTYFDTLTSKILPNAKQLYFTNYADELSALNSRKIEAILDEDSIMMYIMKEQPTLSAIDEKVGGIDYAFIFDKSMQGTPLYESVNKCIIKYSNDGTLEKLQNKWFDGVSEKELDIDYTTLPATNGTIRICCNAELMPFAYVYNNKIIGFDIELLSYICKELGYAIALDDMQFDALILAITSGKYDIACSGFSITEERKKSVLFTSPIYHGNIYFYVIKDKSSTKGYNIVDGFYNTFIKEDRYLLFLKGIFNTLVITILSLILGSTFGFLLCLIYNKGNIVFNNFINIVIWIINRLPLIVLLMIVFYIIFGKSIIDGITISIVGFTIYFSIIVFQLMKTGVSSIQNEQFEAAYTLGYSKNKALFRIILPQVFPIIMPDYKSEITALIKSTAIVGYVTVQDLTKIGDIVRSRTFESIPPILSVAIIYIILAEILIFIVNIVYSHINPTRNKKLLKGVNTHD